MNASPMKPLLKILILFCLGGAGCKSTGSNLIKSSIERIEFSKNITEIHLYNNRTNQMMIRITKKEDIQDIISMLERCKPAGLINIVCAARIELWEHKHMDSVELGVYSEQDGRHVWVLRTRDKKGTPFDYASFEDIGSVSGINVEQ